VEPFARGADGTTLIAGRRFGSLKERGGTPATKNKKALAAPVGGLFGFGRAW